MAQGKSRKEQKAAWKGKRVLVIGAGLSGVAAVNLLHKAGAETLLLEQNEKRSAEEVRAGLKEQDRDNTKIRIGTLSGEELNGIDFCVPSPAVPMDAPLILTLKEKSIPVISEIELAYRLMQGKLVAITGTNGKTTTTTLTGELLSARPGYGYGREVFVVGNIGDAFALHTLDAGKNSVTVAEISSFQLEAVEEFHADVSCIMNITPDHLDRHHTMEAYAKAKERITNLQTKENADFCVLNYMDPYLRAFGEERCTAEVLWFSSGERPPRGLWLNDDDITVVGLSEEDYVLMRFSECRLVGHAGAEDVMAALAIMIALGHEPFSSVEVIRNFKPVPHRIEFIATKRGVDFYNDSKATNPDAAIQGIRAMKKPTVLIGGGYDKHGTYDAWVEAFKDRAKALVLIGETKEAIAACAREHGYTKILPAESLEEALEKAVQTAEEGDAVLLSPACASWGMFANYEERGDRFRAYVEALTE
ncbi:MAG: UDP-N-acetylmuramoyl-L-alanine--D-glutamate ligase [Lachnospiraceae bacterium]|nr:UDP-N-acetylmuramoyl-L-alanine--D-glutamate ligase [Lachnospiraceae bacterium]